MSFCCYDGGGYVGGSTAGSWLRRLFGVRQGIVGVSWCSSLVQLAWSLG